MLAVDCVASRNYFVLFAFLKKKTIFRTYIFVQKTTFQIHIRKDVTDPMTRKSCLFALQIFVTRRHKGGGTSKIIR